MVAAVTNGLVVTIGLRSRFARRNAERVHAGGSLREFSRDHNVTESYSGTRQASSTTVTILASSWPITQRSSREDFRLLGLAPELTGNGAGPGR